MDDNINIIIKFILEYKNYIFYFFIFWMCVLAVLIHIEPPLSILTSNVTAWDFDLFYEKCFVCKKIFSKCFSQSFSILWKKQRNLVYFIIRNKKMQWILDSFLSPKKVYIEWKLQKRKCLIFRCCIYIFGLYFYSVLFQGLLYFILSLIGRTVFDYFRDLYFSYKTSIDFSSLPLPIQQRFYELQTPIIKNQMSKAYLNTTVMSYYKELHIDRLYLRSAETCHKIYYNFACQKEPHLLPYKPILTFCCSINATCKCSNLMLNKIKIIHGIYAKVLPQDKLSKMIIPCIDYSNVKILFISESNLSSNDFMLISKMNLNSIVLCLIYDEINFDEKMVEILDAVVGVSHLRIHYIGECLNPDEFEINLINWVLKNGYIQSLFFIAEFFEHFIAFKSSMDIEFHETPDT